MVNKIPTNIWKFLLHFIKQQPLGFLFITLTATIASLANGSIWPYITGNLVDSFAKLENKRIDSDLLSYIIKPLLIALLFWVFIEVVQRGKGVLLGFIAPKFEANIRMAVFQYVSRHSYSYFVKNYVGSIAHRIDDLPRSARLIVDDILTVFFPLIVSIITSSAVFFSMHPILAAIFFIWLSMHFLLCLAFCTKAASYSSIQSAARAIVQGRIVDVIANYLNVKVFTRHEYEAKNILSAQEEEVTKYKFSLLYVEKFKLLLSCISIINVMVLFYFAIKLWQSGELSDGDIVFTINSTINLMTIMWFAGDEISYVISEIGICKQGLVIIQDSAEAVDEYGAQELKISNAKIEFDAVTFEYMYNSNLFRKQTLVIPGRQKIGLVGFSGSGKTTFASLIIRLYEVTDGIIKIDDQDISKVTIDSLRGSISFVPQEPVLFHRSVIDNIRYANVLATDEEVIEASKKAACHEFIMKMDDGYNSIVGERGSKLSGGQKQRIAIARAILKDAPILIMDEATSALDSITENILQKSMYNLMQGKTVIVIAHRLSTLLNMDRIIVFDKGNIVEDGTHQQLLSKGGNYSLLWNLQHNGLLPEAAPVV